MKIIAFVLSIILLLMPLCTVLSACSKSDTPIYKGMTIRQTEQKATAAKPVDAVFCAADGTEDADEPVTSETSDSDTEDFDDEEIEFDHHTGGSTYLPNSIEKLVNSDVVADEETRYFVDAGVDFILEVHIDNPYNYEIQSFTLNGQKYAGYMFEKGSTMELLLLKVTAPTEPGYTEYTIDAIKYIDGTDIKDVDMSAAGKSIKAGVAYQSALSASISNQTVSTTYIDLSVRIPQHDALSEDSELYIYLSDGKEIIDSKPLKIGDNEGIRFSNLRIFKTYEYGIATTTDLIDGKGTRVHWLLKNKITTASAVEIANVVPSHTSITFEVNQMEDADKITSISLYDSDTKQLVERIGADQRAFKNLVSNSQYILYVDYTYTFNGKEFSAWTKIDNIRTRRYESPNITFGEHSVTDTTADVNGTWYDPDNIANITKVELYKVEPDGDKLIKTNTDGKLQFEGLAPHTEYKVIVHYSYDLKNGYNEIITDYAETQFKTTHEFQFESFSVQNSSVVNIGDTLIFQINLSNSHEDIVWDSVTINGEWYWIENSLSDKNTGICKIQNDGTLGNGNITFTASEISFSVEGESYHIELTENNTASARVCSIFTVKDLYPVIEKDGEYVRTDYIIAYSEYAYFMLEFDNIDGFNILSITGPSYTKTEIIQTDGNRYLLRCKLDSKYYKDFLEHYNFGSSRPNHFDIKYNSDAFPETSVLERSCDVIILEEGQIQYISTVDDLLNIDGKGGYFVLTNDIDLAGILWEGINLTGVFDGNGYSIHNLTYTATVPRTEDFEHYGLFRSVNAHTVIQNLNMVGVNINITFEGFQNLCWGVGSIVGYSYSSATLLNCTVDETSKISANCCKVGGLIGEISNGNVIGCTNRADITGREEVGGIAGNGSGATFTNCSNYGTITGYMTGQICGSGGIIIDCNFNGTVNRD